ncbi:MAG: YicC family protein [Spirochaetes bacterium]|uniref:YicC family protein n=1 Tax=Candidatus Ornithospirochaeta stercoripullorum TaxID=2840899 RepID=A0A9D9H598_9SPIO|nr:YicC family protein [Candidatus Ornithospirochaeta stercoripullorum]
MKSMTGYGHAFFRTDEYAIECEVRGYNSRYLDIVHNISQSLSEYESMVDEKIKERAARGRIEIMLKLIVVRSDVKFTIDEGLLASYKEAYERIAALTDTPSPVLSDYAAVDGIIVRQNDIDSSKYKEGVLSVLEEALDAFSIGKEREGEGTRQDLERLGNQFVSSLEKIRERSAELEEHYRKLLVEKYEELTGDKADESAFMTELGAILVRYSINEEVSRLSVHIAEYRKLIASSEPVGKKLDFLCQEMQRECNTIASKSQLVEINLLVVSMKDDVENIREQIRNIE